VSAAIKATVASVEPTMPANVACTVVGISATEVPVMGWVGVGSFGRTRILEWKRIERVGTIPGAHIFPQLRCIALPCPDREHDRNQDDDDEQNHPHRVIPQNQYTSGDSSPNSPQQRTSADVFVAGDESYAFGPSGVANQSIGGIAGIVIRKLEDFDARPREDAYGSE
jgi:hypothetical protein